MCASRSVCVSGTLRYLVRRCVCPVQLCVSGTLTYPYAHAHRISERAGHTRTTYAHAGVAVLQVLQVLSTAASTLSRRLCLRQAATSTFFYSLFYGTDFCPATQFSP